MCDKWTVTTFLVPYPGRWPLSGVWHTESGHFPHAKTHKVVTLWGYGMQKGIAKHSEYRQKCPCFVTVFLQDLWSTYYTQECEYFPGLIYGKWVLSGLDIWKAGTFWVWYTESRYFPGLIYRKRVLSEFNIRKVGTFQGMIRGKWALSTYQKMSPFLGMVWYAKRRSKSMNIPAKSLQKWKIFYGGKLHRKYLHEGCQFKKKQELENFMLQSL